MDNTTTLCEVGLLRLGNIIPWLKHGVWYDIEWCVVIWVGHPDDDCNGEATGGGMNAGRSWLEVSQPLHSGGRDMKLEAMYSILGPNCMSSGGWWIYRALFPQVGKQASTVVVCESTGGNGVAVRGRVGAAPQPETHAHPPTAHAHPRPVVLVGSVDPLGLVFYDIDPKKNGGGDGGEMVEGDVE
ncbi:hypothetical protein Tco_0705206 [Tanacetum coccineum]|uniref:Uncharacterized protein n=1 Tax=Tanacetum coccineum TaxID=301880 RepID=A0ABQ4Y4S9_9ASTR